MLARYLALFAARLEEYRKAIAAFLFGLGPVGLAFLPVLEALPGAVFAATSAALAGLAAFLFENRVDGWNVQDAARWLRDEIAAGADDVDPPAEGDAPPPAA